jgi:oligopeptide transport system substrate-binding protein
MKFVSLFVSLTLISLLGCIYFFRGSSSSSGHGVVMKTAFASEPLTLDPRKNADIYSSFAQKMLFEGLTRLEEEGKVEWGVAKSVAISEDLRTYTFTLRTAQWSDGTPITAYDFEYAWKKVLDPSFGAPSTFLFYPIENAQKASLGEVPLEQVPIRALDAHTLQVRLSHPTPYFLSLISFCCFFPAPKHIAEANPHWAMDGTPLVSNGPYKLVEWVHNTKLSMKKRESYWDARSVSLDGIEIQIIPDEKTALRMFEKGELDLLGSLTTPLSLDDLGRLKQEKQLQVSAIGGTCFTTFNLSHPLFCNPKIRKAFSLATNRQSITQGVLQMEETPALEYMAPAITGKEASRLIDDCNPLLAKTLFLEGLAELHRSSDSLEPITLSYLGNEQYRRLALCLQQQWQKALGVPIKLQELEMKSLMKALEEKRYTVALFFWAAHYLDPMSILDRFKSKQGKKNYPGFEKQEYVALLEAAQTSIDPKMRDDFLMQAEKMMIEEMPLSPIFHFKQGFLQSRRIEKICISPIGDPLYKQIQPVAYEK